MKTVKEVSKISGVSVRTLHYYDGMGLLKPTKKEKNGYRYYDDAAMGRLQEILFFRELDFPLKEIKELMENPHYDRKKALQQHMILLNMKKKRIEAIIALANNALQGEKKMDFKAFDDTEIKKQEEAYRAEAKERWGETEAYRESEDKRGKFSDEEWQAIRKEMDALMYEFGQRVGSDPKDPVVQDLVKQWQEYLTKYYYDCTMEILGGLGQMYVADERFTENIDKYGKGTAALLSAAIGYYVRK